MLAYSGRPIHRAPWRTTNLPPLEEKILRLRFGIGLPAAPSLAHVARAMSLSRERVRQLEAEAMEKLRAPGVVSELA